MLATIKNQNNIQFEGKLAQFISSNVNKIKLSKQIKEEMLKTAKDKEEYECIKNAHVFRILRMKELCDLGVDVKHAYIYSYDGGGLFEKIKNLAKAGKYERYHFLTRHNLYGETLSKILDMNEEDYSIVHEMLANNIEKDLIFQFIKDYPNDIKTICSFGKTEQINSKAIPFFLKKKETNKNFSEKNITSLAQTQIFSERMIYDILSLGKTDKLNIKDFEEIRKILAKIKINNDDFFDFIRWNEDYMKSEIPYKSYDFLLNEIFSIQETDLNKYSLDDRLKIYFELFSLFNSGLLNEEEISKINLEQTLAKLEKTIKNPIAHFDITKEDKEMFFKNYISNNSPWIEDTIKNFDFKKYETQGLPLKYTRENYLKDLKELLTDCTENQKEEIYKKLEIINLDDEGYDGILTTNNLDLNNETENKVYKLTNAFIKENEILTHNPNLNKIINSIIKAMPEFINIIGKKQHRNQTLDVHTFLVIQNVFKNKNYETLSNKEKTVLKFSALLHDIAKKEFIIDKNHPKKSAIYSSCILDKFDFSSELNDMIINIIKNHHWLEDYSKQTKTAQQIACDFKSEEKFNIAKILTEADLKGVGDDFYNYHKDVLERILPIVSSLQEINNFSQIIFSNKIINPNLLPKTIYKYKEYKVADFSKYSKEEDLSKIGFEPNTTKENLRLMVHVSNKIENLEALMKIDDTNSNSLLCASYISLKNKATYLELPFGLNFDVPCENVINASQINQASGRKKGDEQLNKILSDNLFRNSIPSAIKGKAKITNNEYRELYTAFSHFRHLSQIKDDEIYNTSNNKIYGRDIKRIIKTSNDKLLSRYHNEINLYKPIPNAFIAKVDSIEEIPDKYLEFVHKHNLPILILGK